jgi:hypothetical protein
MNFHEEAYLYKEEMRFDKGTADCVAFINTSGTKLTSTRH